MIAEYTFLPWLRRGIANQLQTPALSASRATLQVSVTVRSEVAADRVSKDLQLVGPGDVIGFNANMVVRTEPRHWITDFEPNYLAFIEFYDEDFPWRYTPTVPDTAQHRLVPWIFLIVLKGGEFRREHRPDRPLPSIKLTPAASTAALFPPQTQLWAWAHVQVNEGLGGGSAPNLDALDTLLYRNPDQGLSRLVCPRRLEPNTGYSAFVIPTFEVGRRAGLNEDVPDALSGLEVSWSVATEFPTYFEWYFRTGAAGDFEELVRVLTPRPMDPRVGVREMDIQRPGFNMPDIVNPPDGLVWLEGALKAPTTGIKGLASTSNFPHEIGVQVNAEAERLSTGMTGSDDPVVTAPLYGRWHALVNRLSLAPADRGWINELNADPRFRAAAGLGTRVIQKNQEAFMQQAWQQIGEVLAANRKIQLTQVALAASMAVYEKHLRTLPAERALPILAPTLAKIMGSPVTVHYLVRNSCLPVAALSGPFRKQMRPRGNLAKRAFPGERRQPPLASAVSQLSRGDLSAAPPRPFVIGPTLEKVAERTAPRLGPWLKQLVRLNQPIAAGVFSLLAILLFVAPGVIFKLLVLGASAAAVSVYRRSETLRQTLVAVESLMPANLTQAAVNNVPARPGFALVQPGEVPSALRVAGSADNETAQRFRTAVAGLHQMLGPASAPRTPLPPLALADVHATLMQALDPVRAYPRRIASWLRVGEQSLVDYTRRAYHDSFERAVSERVVPVMAHPDIKKPMYEGLRDISTDLLVPNLRLVPNNTISLMVTNQPFIEAYMVGVNHEFARELLWREYPTDQRPSTFRQFWDVAGYVDRERLEPQVLAEKLRDITPIHTWPRSSNLGGHNNREAQGDAEQLVLVIRGDVLKRYPNTVIYAQRAKWGEGDDNRDRLVLWDETGERIESNLQDSNIRFPLYKATVHPDIHFIGFDLTIEEVRGSRTLDETEAARRTVPATELGWFFVLQEVPGEPRFGLDEHAPTTASEITWDNLAWENIGSDVEVIDVVRPFAVPPAGTENPNNVSWGSNAADMAHILYQKPVLIAIHAREMLKNVS